MTEAFKEVFFGLFWFTADCILIWLWTMLFVVLLNIWRNK